ncbi:hypothetical protein A1355_02485 [Methylomonas koyamae]|uniref:Uncharacterized protein n=1 Tax=Methylomonas koyamae TaxID=702114 RepID=A0A177NXW9_9GAMM|nr:hypothetical protein A1355_02485 [Methylomonas koyamae]
MYVGPISAEQVADGLCFERILMRFWVLITAQSARNDTGYLYHLTDNEFSFAAGTSCLSAQVNGASLVENIMWDDG